jgi:beta-lactamase class A
MTLKMLLKSILWVAFFYPVLAQPEGRGIIGQKTFKALERIAEEAQGVLGLAVIDLETGEIFSINGELVFPQGSAIKIPILLEVYQQASEGKFSLSDQIRIAEDLQVGGSGILKELGDGTSRLSVQDLCVLMIHISDNTATNLLIDLVGMDNVNRTMKELGLAGIRLRRKMMDTAARARGDENVATPVQAALLLQMIHHQKLGEEICEKTLNLLRRPKSGGFSEAIPGVPIAFKAGGIPGVRTEWALVELPGRPFIAIFMEAYDRTGESEKILREVARILYDYFWRLENASIYGTFVDQ